MQLLILRTPPAEKNDFLLIVGHRNLEGEIQEETLTLNLHPSEVTFESPGHCDH